MAEPVPMPSGLALFGISFAEFRALSPEQ